MQNDMERTNDNAVGSRDDDGLQLGRSVFLRHAAFSSPDPAGRDTIRRYASFTGRAGGITIARWISGDGRSNWPYLGQLKGALLLGRKSTSEFPRQAAAARSFVVRAAENEGRTASGISPTPPDRIEAPATLTPLTSESSVSGAVTASSVGFGSSIPGSSISRGVETDRARTALPLASETRTLHLAEERMGPLDDGTIPASTVLKAAASLRPMSTPTAGIARGQHTVLSRVVESRAAKTFQGPPIFQRSHLQHVRAEEGNAGMSKSVGSPPAERAGLSGPAGGHPRSAGGQLIEAEQHAAAMPRESREPGAATFPVEPVLLRPSPFASANAVESFDARTARHSNSQANSPETIRPDSAAMALQTAARTERNNDHATSSAGPPPEPLQPIQNSHGEPVTPSLDVPNIRTSFAGTETLIKHYPRHGAKLSRRDSGRAPSLPLLASTTEGPAHIAPAQLGAVAGAAHSTAVKPEKIMLSCAQKESSASNAPVALPEPMKGLDRQVDLAAKTPGESTQRFLQSRSAAALHVPKVQRFAEGLLQRHTSLPIANVGAGAGSGVGPTPSRPVVQWAPAQAQHSAAASAIAPPPPAFGAQSTSGDLAVMRAVALDPQQASTASPLTNLLSTPNASAHEPERLASGRDPVTQDSRSESPSHFSGRPAVMAESSVEPPGAVAMALAPHGSADSASENRAAPSFAGARNERAGHEHLRSAVAETGQASPGSSAGLEAKQMVSGGSPKISASSLTDAPNDTLSAQQQNLLRSGQHGAVHREPRPPGPALRPAFKPDSARGDSRATAFALTGNGAASHGSLGSGNAANSHAGPVSSAGFEALQTAPRSSLGNSSAAGAGTTIGAHRSWLQRPLRSGHESAAQPDASASGEALNPLPPQAVSHPGFTSRDFEPQQSAGLTFRQNGVMPAEAHVLRTFSDPAYTSQWQSEQALAVTQGTSLRRNDSALTRFPTAEAPRNLHYSFPASATSSMHSSSGSVAMHHAASGARGPQIMAASTQSSLLLRGTLSAPSVPVVTVASPGGLPSAPQPASPTAPGLRNVDIAQLANRVYDLLVRRLSSERQRRGM
jgi:hypothetical protein